MCVYRHCPIICTLCNSYPRWYVMLKLFIFCSLCYGYIICMHNYIMMMEVNDSEDEGNANVPHIDENDAVQRAVNGNQQSLRSHGV